MKKLLTLVALFSVLAVSNASAGWFGRGNCCERPVRREVCAPKVRQLPTIEAPAPRCTKVVSNTVSVAPEKICQTNCHYVCPTGYNEEACDNGDNY